MPRAVLVLHSAGRCHIQGFVSSVIRQVKQRKPGNRQNSVFCDGPRETAHHEEAKAMLPDIQKNSCAESGCQEFTFTWPVVCCKRDVPIGTKPGLWNLPISAATARPRHSQSQSRMRNTRVAGWDSEVCCIESPRPQVGVGVARAVARRAGDSASEAKAPEVRSSRVLMRKLPCLTCIYGRAAPYRAAGNAENFPGADSLS